MHNVTHATATTQAFISARSTWQSDLAGHQKLLAQERARTHKSQDALVLEDLVAQGLVYATDCSALMLMEHKQTEEIYTVSKGSRTELSYTYCCAFWLQLVMKQSCACFSECLLAVPRAPLLSILKPTLSHPSFCHTHRFVTSETDIMNAGKQGPIS